LFACGGAAVDPAVIEHANAVFSAQPAVRVYGSSEAPLVSIGIPGGERQSAAALTDGEITGYEVRILDAAGDLVPDGREGELVARGAPLFLGYADLADSVEAFTADGFFRTGDLAVLDGTTLTITGRKKDLIIRGGENISPREIELVIAEHSAIEEVAVVAMPHERLGEGICACVILKSGMELDFDALSAFVRQAGLSRQKTPERLDVLTNFPRTPSGKIKKDELRKMIALRCTTNPGLVANV
jgi:acyl-CoA synthetase (AMP-forming)/AMP-acid ligase II